MSKEKRFLVDVGISDLPFPIVVRSRSCPQGQPTITNISIKARIMQEFEPVWINRFIEILHGHRDNIGLDVLATNIQDYHRELDATSVHVDMAFPYFYEKLTPVTREKCLVRYHCTYSGSYPSVVDKGLRATLSVDCPAITSYPVCGEDGSGISSGQLSIMRLEVIPKTEIFVDDLIELVDRHALSPVYSYLKPEDQCHLMQRISRERKTSVELIDEVKSELARDANINWYSLACRNFGMLHVYNTVINTEKSYWVPFSGIEDSEI